MVFHGKSLACDYVCPKCGDVAGSMGEAMSRIWRGRAVRALLWCGVLTILISGAALAVHGW